MALPSDIRGWITDTAQGNLPLNTQRDASPLDPFYREYEAASDAEKRLVDATFVEFIQAATEVNDPAVLEFCASHVNRFFPPAQAFSLIQTLWDKTITLRAKKPEPLVWGIPFSAHLLGALSQLADDVVAKTIGDLILKEAPKLGVVTRQMVWVFAHTTRNFAGIDTLVKTVKPAKNLKDALWGAGYTMRHWVSTYLQTVAHTEAWPAGLKKSYLAGARAYEKSIADRLKWERGWHWEKPPDASWENTGQALVKLSGVWWWTEQRNPLYDNIGERKTQNLDELITQGPADTTVPAAELKEMVAFAKGLRKKRPLS